MSEKTKDTAESEKCKYREILEGKCVLVEDQWFAAEGTEKARREHRRELRRREKRNRRRRLRRRVLKTAALKEAQAAASTRRDDSPVQRMVEDAQWQLFHRPSYEILVHPSEVLTLVLLFDLVGFLDRVVRHLVRLALEDGAKTNDPEIVREIALVTNGRTPRRYASAAPLDAEHRLACERRKLLCRTTTAGIPTATDLRVAWRFRKNSYEDMLALGGLLVDLECHLDNSLRRETRGGRPRIRGRNPGFRGWLRENCPELVGKYFTLMRCKAMVRRLRQALEVPDPVPTSTLADETETATGLLSREVHVQPRGTVVTSLVRFPWERGEWRTDAGGRRFLTNSGYELAPGWSLGAAELSRRLAEARRELRDILSTARTAAARSTSGRHPRMAAVHLYREILRRVNAREIWWRGPLAAVGT